MKDTFYQVENQEFIKTNLGKELWVPVYVKKDINKDTDVMFWSALIPKDKKEEIIDKHHWDFSIGNGMPGMIENGDGTVYYDRFSDYGGIEPLVFVRDFSGVRESYIEISEEFRLLNNLYHEKEKNKYYHIDETASENLVIKIKNKNVYVRLALERKIWVETFFRTNRERQI